MVSQQEEAPYPPCSGQSSPRQSEAVKVVETYSVANSARGGAARGRSRPLVQSQLAGGGPSLFLLLPSPLNRCMEQRTAGRLIFIATSLAYAYYTIWLLVVVSGKRARLPLLFGALSLPCRAPRPTVQRCLPHPQPFIDEDQPTRRLFPSPYYAIAPPVLAGVALWGATLVTLGCFLVSSELRKWVLLPGGLWC